MTTITYHDRYVGESGRATMFSRRHYWAIATMLKKANADIQTIEVFVGMLEADNPQFKPDLFRKASV